MSIDDRESTKLVLEVVAVAEDNGLKLPREFGLLLKQVENLILSAHVSSILFFISFSSHYGTNYYTTISSSLTSHLHLHRVVMTH